MTRRVPAEERAWLRTYDPAAFPPFGVTVDVVVLTVRPPGAFSVLLVERDTHPFRGDLALPGGFVQPDEDLDAAAARRLATELGVSPGAHVHVEQLGAFGAPDRDPRMRVVSVAYLVFAPDLPPPLPGRTTRSVAWVPVDDVPSRLAFDHGAVLAAGVERARAKLEYTPLAAAFCADEFTVADLRTVYEAVWGGPLDPRNFHRKVTGTPGFLVPVGRPAPVGPGGGRPAALFRRGPATTLHPAMLRPARPTPGGPA